MPIRQIAAPPNTRMQPTAFGARDRAFFEVISCGAPRRRLMRNPFGTRGKASSIPLLDWDGRITLPERALCQLRRASARYASRGTQARSADCPLCRLWYDGPLCCSLVMGSAIVCWAWFKSTPVVPTVVLCGA
jgi:hypothetical protein